jgi:hypothetical protein
MAHKLDRARMTRHAPTVNAPRWLLMNRVIGVAARVGLRVRLISGGV